MLPDQRAHSRMEHHGQEHRRSGRLGSGCGARPGAGLGAILGENFDRMRRQNPNSNRTLGPTQLDPEEGEEAK